MIRVFVVSMLVLGVGCSKSGKESSPKTTPAPQDSAVQTEPVAKPESKPEAKTETTQATKEPSKKTLTEPKTKTTETPEEASESAPKKEVEKAPVKTELAKPAKPAAEPRNQQTVTLPKGEYKTMEFAGNPKALVNGGTTRIYKLNDVSRLKLLGVKFELNLTKVPLDHIVSFTYAGRFDIHLTTETGLRKICGEGFAEIPVQVKGRKPGRPIEISFPKLVLSSFIGEDNCGNSVSKSNLSTPVVYSLAPVEGKTQMEIMIHEPVQVNITNHLNEDVAPGTYPVGFNVILQTEISN